MEPQFSFTSSTGAEVMPTDAVAALPAPTDVPSTAFAPETPVVAPQQVPNTSNISLFADSISLSNGDCDGKAIFDIVLTVSWADGENYQTAKIVKSVSFDKLSILEHVNCATPVTVVEQVQQKKDNSKLLRTMRELAGVAGKDTFV